MSHFVADNIRTFAGIEYSPLNRIVKEMQARRFTSGATRVKRIEVRAAIE